MTEQAASTTVVRYYVENGEPKAEAVIWRWVRPRDPNRSEPVDQGLVDRARPLPREFDPGLVPNLWVWVAANDAAAKLPRPTETIRGETMKSDGSIQETVDHVHGVDSSHWDYYRLPLRSGVELIGEDEWRALAAEKAERLAAQQKEREDAQRAARDARASAKASARAKLAALGLDDDEISAIVGG